MLKIIAVSIAGATALRFNSSDIGTVIKIRPDNTVQKTFLDIGPNGGGVPRRESYLTEKKAMQILAQHKGCDEPRQHFPELRSFDDAKMQLIFDNLGVVFNKKNWNPFHKVKMDKSFCIKERLTAQSIKAQSQ